MKILTIVLLLALAGCKHKPGYNPSAYSGCEDLRSVECPGSATWIMRQSLAVTGTVNGGASTNEEQKVTATPVEQFGFGKTFRHFAGKDWHNDGKHWERVTCYTDNGSERLCSDKDIAAWYRAKKSNSSVVLGGQIIASDQEVKFDSINNAEALSVRGTGDLVSREMPISFQVLSYASPLLILQFDTAAKDDIERWGAIYKTGTKWTFSIEGKDYVLTGKELAEAVVWEKTRMPQVYDGYSWHPMNLPIESVTGNELDTRQIWENLELITGQCEPVCLVTIKDKQGRLIELYDSPDRYVHRPNPFVAQANGSWKVYVDRGVELKITESK